MDHEEQLAPPGGFDSSDQEAAANASTDNDEVSTGKEQGDDEIASSTLKEDESEEEKKDTAEEVEDEGEVKSSREGDVLVGYAAGRRSCEDVLRAARTYRGRESHWLWEPLSPLPAGPEGSAIRRARYQFRSEFLFKALTEERMFVLLQALVEDDPGFPLKRHAYYGCFLHIALTSMVDNTRRIPNVSSRVVLLLAVKGTTRVPGGESHSIPLHFACIVPNIELEVIDRLLELDPDILDLPSGPAGPYLLHVAFCHNRENVPVLTRLVEASPDEALLRTYHSDPTPIVMALQIGLVSPQMASFLEMTINRYPACVGNLSYRWPLHFACDRFHEYPDLLLAVIRARPVSLGSIPFPHNSPPLPIELLAQKQSPSLALVEEETLLLALAFVELAIEGPFFAADDATDEQEIEKHVRDTVAAYLPSLLAKEDEKLPYSGFAVAEAVRALGNRFDFCRDLLNGNVHMFDPFRRIPSWVKTLEDVYRMNRQGRSNPSVAHQVNLLASVNDNLDCLYLQARQFGGHLMSQSMSPTSTGRKRRRDDLN